MSRLSVVRWTPTPGDISNITSNSSLGSWSPSRAEEWVQSDVIISACMITALALHAHCCRLTKAGMSTFLALASLLVTLILAPLVGSMLLMFSCYRCLVTAYLKFRLGLNFSGLLHGTDAFWALEDETSLSVINVLALADFSFIVEASTQEDEPLQTISELIQDRLLTASTPFPKLLCHRHHFRMGYFYWVKQQHTDISESVRWMEVEDEGDQTITESALKNFVSSVTNCPLPSNHKCGWEILVGRYPIKPSSDLLDAMENGGWITKSCVGVRYPVLFRIHHSIGDGVALVNLLLDALADPNTRSNTPLPHLRSSSPIFEKNFIRPSPLSLVNALKDNHAMSFWQESDMDKSKNISLCEFNSILVVKPPDTNLTEKSSNCCFEESEIIKRCTTYKLDGMKSSVRNAYQKVLRFLDNTKEFKKKLEQKDINYFDVAVNDRPSGEFLNLLENSTSLESKYVSHRHVQNSYNHVEFVLKKGTKLLNKLMSLVNSYLESTKTTLRQWSVLCFAPVVIFNQILGQARDVNILHGPKMSGYKVIAWYLEQQDNPDQLLMAMIKRIRSKTGVKFSDVLLTAVSESLESFYSQSGEVPRFITVVIPARLGSPEEAQALTKVIGAKTFSTKVTKIVGSVDTKLENKFSVAMLSLPIANESESKIRLFCKLRQVRKQCDVLRHSPDYIINYWLLRVVATLVPSWILRPLLKSNHSTMVLSNLPGPPRLTKLAGHMVHDLVFWVPNRTTTGVGLTVLSYAGRLQLGLMADRALIGCQQDAQMILDGVALAIQHMDQISSPA